MAQVNAGRVRFVSRGEYNNSTQYYLFDLVDYNGSSYFAKANTTGNVPTNTTYWQLVAEKGNTGGDGPVGPTGNGIASIVKTASAGLIDTYTITFTNGSTTTFNVTNGQDGDVTQEYVDEENERLKSVFNVLPKVSDSGESIELENTGDTMLYKMDLKGNTSQEVIQGEVGLEEEDTSIYVDDVNEDKENYITLKGNTYQETTSISGGDQYDSPSPDYPQEIEVVTGLNEVRVEGKNLFDKDNANILGAYIALGNSKITYSNGDNCIYIPVKSNTTYTVSKILSKRFIVGFTDVLPATAVVCNPISTNQPSNTSITITSGNDSKYLVVNCYTNTDTPTLQEILNSIQIEQSSTATTYEEYKGQTYPISLDYTNLFKKQDISSDDLNKRLNQIGEDYNENGYFTSPFIKVDKDTQYTINYTPTAYTRICYYASNNTNSFISKNDDTSSFTTPSTCQYLRFCNLMADIDNIRLEKGSTITNNYIELCNIGTYQDRIYKSNGNWYLHKEIGKVILNGSETWQQSGYTNETIYSTYSQLNDYKQNSVFISNLFTYVSNVDGTTSVEYISTGGDSIRIGIFKSRLTAYTINEFKTWLSNNNVTIYYPLATSTDTQITDTTLISQLNALYNATIYSTTHINTETSNLLPYIDLKYNVVTASPSPDRASEVEVVKGNNTITISNEDGTKTQSYNLTLGNIELCKIGDYQDYFYKDNGNWYKYAMIGKVVLDGSEEWQNQFGESLFGTNLTNKKINTNSLSYCNRFKFHNIQSGLNANLLNGEYTIQIGTNDTLYCKDTNYTNTTDFKNWLSTHNTNVYYPLATPTQTQITDQLLVSQLDELQKAMSYYDKTLISQVNDSKPFILDVVAIRDLQDIFELISGE